jgi:sterol desaturase/sphingolipid hydroxylase (fatty acid hydroxylase superfamily)
MAFFSFLSWFRPWWKTSETDYDTVLNRLTKDIDSVQGRLVHINRRERRASITLTLYAILVWLVYAVFLWYWTAAKRLEMTKRERVQLWSPVWLGLVFIIFARFLVRFWYRRIATGEGELSNLVILASWARF